MADSLSINSITYCVFPIQALTLNGDDNFLEFSFIFMYSKKYILLSLPLQFIHFSCPKICNIALFIIYVGGGELKFTLIYTHTHTHNYNAHTISLLIYVLSNIYSLSVSLYLIQNDHKTCLRVIKNNYNKAHKIFPLSLFLKKKRL